MDESKASKILVVGDSGVGKTSLVHLMCTGKPLTASSWTVGCNVHIKLYDSSQTQSSDESMLHSLEFWDVGGSSRYSDTRPIFWNCSPDAIILVHDLSNRRSYENLNTWHSEVMRHPEERGEGNAKTDIYDPETTAGTGHTPLVMVIGTKLDKSPNKSIGRCLLADSLGGTSASINALNPGALKGGTQARVELDKFFDRIVSRKNSNPAYMTSPSHNSRRKFVDGLW